jgi:hypothetical protein
MKQIKPSDAARISGGTIPSPESLGIDTMPIPRAEPNPLEQSSPPREPQPVAPIPGQAS